MAARIVIKIFRLVFKEESHSIFRAKNDFALLNVSSLNVPNIPQIKLLYTFQYQYWDISVEEVMEKIVIQVTSSDEDTDTATECSDYSDTESADEVY